MSPLYFISNQLHMVYPIESFIKLGVCTAFIKDKNQDYSFNGKKFYETDDVVVFTGLPKCIELDGENLLGALELEYDFMLSTCYKLKQDNECSFEIDHFMYKGRKYKSILDLDKFN